MTVAETVASNAENPKRTRRDCRGVMPATALFRSELLLQGSTYQYKEVLQSIYKKVHISTNKYNA